MELAFFLMSLGGLFLLGLAADTVGRLTRLPRVTMLLLLGLIFGNAGLELIPYEVTLWFETLSIIALTMVAFLLGGSFSTQIVAKRGRVILGVSLAIVATTMLILPVGLAAVGMEVGLVLILAAIATATDPAAISDVIRQSAIGNDFTDTLKGIVAIDDGWGLIVFSVVLALVGQSESWASALTGISRDIGGAILLGAAVGLPAAYLTGRLRPGEPQQAEAIGIVFLVSGLALWTDVSFLIAGMTAGAVVANMAKHHERAFHEIEHIQWPFMLLFFLLAGATLELDSLRAIGWIGALYIGLRVLARLVGGWAGAKLSGVGSREAFWYGPALLPQAGVAVGMALVVSDTYPDWSEIILTLTVAGTVFFELFGPPIALFAIHRVARRDS